MIEPPRGDAPWERLQLITNGVDTSHRRSWIRPKPAAAADAKEFLTSRKKKPLLNFANHRNMTGVVNQPKGGDPVSHCLPSRVIDEAWVIVRAKEFRA
jgi:hypothetical protein